MKHAMIGLVLVAGLAAPAAADTWSVGYGAIPAGFSYGIDDANAKSGSFNSQGQDDFSLSQLSLLYDHDRKVSDSIHLSLVTGIGFPMSTGKHDASKGYVNYPGTTPKDFIDTGDSTEYSLLTVPILVGVKYGMAMGDNALSIGVSAGAMLLGMQTKTTDVSWGGVSDAKTCETVMYRSAVAPAYAILGTVAYHLKQGEGTAISISANVGVVGEVRGDTESTFVTTPTGEVNPQKTGLTVGGMTYGINIGWSKSFQ